MHMICTSVPISASTELTEFLYISCRQKITAPIFRRPLSAGTRVHLPLSHLPSATADELPQQKFGLLCFCYAVDITYKMKFSFFICCCCFRPYFYINLHAVCKLTCPNDFRNKQKVAKLMVGSRTRIYIIYRLTWYLRLLVLSILTCSPNMSFLARLVSENSGSLEKFNLGAPSSQPPLRKNYLQPRISKTLRAKRARSKRSVPTNSSKSAKP